MILTARNVRNKGIHKGTFDFPQDITSIERRAFDGCSKLERVVIPDGVTTVRSFVFNNCVNLKEVTIPNSVVDFGHDVFMGCPNLEKITLKGNFSDRHVKYLKSKCPSGVMFKMVSKDASDDEEPGAK